METVKCLRFKMHYKPDWEKTQKRIEAWWHHEVIDRCCIAVQAPRANSKHPPFQDLQLGPWLGGTEQINADDTEAIKHGWQDPEENYQRMLAWFENTLFAGEALPITYIDWGSAALAGILGSPMKFTKSTVKYSPVILDWGDWHWSFDENHPIWEALSAILNRLIKGAGENFFVGPPNLGGGGDVLSIMRGVNRLFTDLVDKPEDIKESLDFISEVGISLMEQVHLMTSENNHSGGVIPWLGLWAPGRTGLLACDISGVISPETFRNIFLPDIEKVAKWCEYSIYHLDGPACMTNTLDIILEIDKVKAIQFSPGIGQAPSYSEAYIPQYRKILKKGKGLYLLVEPEDVEKLMSFLPPEGLFLRTNVDSEVEAKELIRKTAQWTAEKIR